MCRGDLIEVSLELEGKTIFLGGVVAFCRPVEGAVHEVGVQVFDRADQPIFSTNPAEALERLDWVQQFAGDGGNGALRRSA